MQEKKQHTLNALSYTCSMEINSRQFVYIAERLKTCASKTQKHAIYSERRRRRRFSDKTRNTRQLVQSLLRRLE